MEKNFFLMVVCVGLCACSTFRDTVSFSVDYTNPDSISIELAAISKLVESHPVKALLRVTRLQRYFDKPVPLLIESIRLLCMQAQKAAESRLQHAIDKQHFTEARAIVRSLAAVGMPSEIWTETAIVNLQIAVWKNQGIAALLMPAVVLPDTVVPTDGGDSMQKIREKMGGVVTVWVDKGIAIQKGVGRADRMIGSGFFIDKSGYLITNYHVIQSEVDPSYEGYSRVYIKRAAPFDIRIPAKVVGWDPVFDIALLKAEIESEVFFSFGSSKDLKIGSNIYAIGSPAGLEQTLTSGIVSAKDRRFLSLGSVLQIDAPVNQGSSGGPIVDDAGRVQAVVFAGLEQHEGLNFAIPIELLKVILPDLFLGGKVNHAWAGAYGKTLAEKSIYDALPPNTAGVSVVYTIPGSPAAHIPQGSVITHINGTAVSSLEDLQAALMQFAVGTIIQCRGYQRQKTLFTEKNIPAVSFTEAVWYVLLEARPEYPVELVFQKDSTHHAVLPLYGLYLEHAGYKKSFRITDVLQGSSADESGFTAGDYLEIRSMEIVKDQQGVFTRIYTKRRKTGYLDAFMDIWAYLDSPSYF